MHFKQMCRAMLMALIMMVAMNAKSQTLVWADEFDQPKLSAEKWSTEVGGSGFGNGELQYYTSGESNVFIGSKLNPSDTGYLVIEARRENYGVSPENKQFTSGRIHTSGKFNFKYGTIEARIKLPDLEDGLWPAFWMLGANYPNVGWPRSGEIDILEAGFRDDWQNNIANQKASTTVHWFQDNYLELVPNAHEIGWWGNASVTGSTVIEGSFNDGFHLFKLTWTPTEIQGFVDGVHFYSFAIPASDPNITEFNHPFYLIMNLAVGGSNFVGITDPNQITAPMPAQMQVDYVRVYSNEYTESFESASLPRETGNFGVFTETTSVTNSLGESPNIEVWSNLAAASAEAQEGSNVLAYTANPGNWFGMGIPTATGDLKNMQNFIDGHLHFHMKTSSAWPISIGVIGSANGNAQPGTQAKPVRLDPAGNQYGLVRDGEWHEVVIPMSAFGNVEFRSMTHMFYLVGDNPTSPVTFAIDNIYWSDGTKITPENGDYVIYSDTKVGVDSFDLGLDGQFYIWEATLNAQATTAAEGANSLSYTHNNKGWFGAAFTASAMHNLTAYNNANGKLVFSLKTSDTSSPFYIGMKSGTRDGEGQKWIAFEPAQTPYGFQRNGTWQVVEIPMSDFSDAVNLMEVVQIFQILGIGNISNIAIDNIYFSGGGTADPDLGANALPVANAGPNLTLRPPGDTVVIAGSATDADGTIASYAWSVQSGPSLPYLDNDSTATLTASGLVNGTYVFTLTVTDDDGAADTDNVSVFVGPNMLPTANAGNDRTISLPSDSVSVQGSGADVDGTIAGYQWANVSGPNTPTILSGNSSQLRAMGLVEGTYTFSLTVTDNEGGTDDDLVTVVVTPNSPPTANAGDDQTITLPTNSITITGSGSDTGLISGYSWSTVSGPTTPTLSGENTASVTASNLSVGTYVLMFMVTDNGGLSAYDSVSITVNEAPVNLALLKTVTTSSVENGTTLGSNAVDGNQATRWASAFSDPQWIYVDLGASYVINRVKIKWEAAMAKDYVVEVSSDASSWENIKTVTNNSSVDNEHTGLSATGRYVRIYGTVRALPYGYSIFELEVYGEPSNEPQPPVVNAGNDQTISLPTSSAVINGSASDIDGSIVNYEWAFVSGPSTPSLSGQNTASLTASTLVQGTYVFSLTVTDNDSLTASDEVAITVIPKPNLALNKPTLFSSAENVGTLGASANDGNMGTRWASAFFDPQWWYVDLGQTYSIEQVKIFWEGAMGKDYQIQVSDDTENWTTIKNVVGNNSTFNDHTGLSGAGRYVRMYGTARATPWGYSFWEFEVYGSEYADVNEAPSVSIAGENLVVNLPQNSIQLNGWASDSDGTIASYAWTMIDGPGSVTMTGSDTDSVMIEGLTAGLYVFRLTATDNDGTTAFEDDSVFVNAPPSVFAGGDQFVHLPQTSIQLSGSADDNDGAITSFAWSLVSGPEPVEMWGDSTEIVSIDSLTSGTYVVRLTVTDNNGSHAYDDVVIYVNSPPVAFAGEDQTITVPQTSIILSGDGSDVDGQIVSYEWSQVSGPTLATLDNDSTQTVSVNGLIEGTYVFALTVTDNMGSNANDEVLVIVAPSANLALFKPVTVSSMKNENSSGAHAVDGNLETHWTSVATHTQWLYVDLGATFALSQIRVVWGTAYGRNYKIQVSTDAVNWTEIKSITNNSNFVNDHTDISGSGRFVRIYATKMSKSRGYSIHEVEVFGTPNAAPIANAGSDKTIISPSRNVTLYGDAYDTDGSIVNYSWVLISGRKDAKLAGLNTPTLEADRLRSGIYIFRLTVTDNQGLSSTDDVTVTLQSTGREAQELAIIDEAVEIQFYPNPAKDFLMVEGLEDGSEVFMIPATGAQQYRKVVTNRSIDIVDVPTGLYILDCRNGVRKKIIKE